MRRRRPRNLPTAATVAAAATAPATTDPAVPPIHPSPSYKPRPHAADLAATAFTLFAPLRILSALLTPPADCDEVFNYWEPLHRLLFPHALQTWEYSPAFALRSYAFLLPYAAVARLALFAARLRWALPVLAALSPKVLAFYAVRLAQAFVCTAAEALLVAAVRERFDARVAHTLVVMLMASPGMFRAAVELLPSSFAMIVITVALAAWLVRRERAAVALVAVAALLGWVFAAALGLPLALHVAVAGGGLRLLVKEAAAWGVGLLAAMTAVDSYFYGRLVVAPVNHLLYNVFSQEGAGSHLFGVEGPAFYIINLLLNWNVAALLVASFPLLFVLSACGVSVWGDEEAGGRKRLIYTSPLYIWLTIFMTQPHKEERFLAPCYTFVALAAAIAFTDWVNLISQCLDRVSSKRASSQRAIFKRAASFALIAISAALGAGRIIMQVRSFRAPLRVYSTLSHRELQDGIGPRNCAEKFLLSQQEINICIGKEWYRFPSSFFLPGKRFRVRFVRAGFEGLMPKPFAEHAHGTRAIPAGMNEFNKEEPSQYYSWTSGVGCHYLIDLDLTHRISESETLLADEQPIPPKSRLVVFSAPFLDSEASAAGFRAFFVPGADNKTSHGHYQLIRNLDLLPLAS